MNKIVYKVQLPEPGHRKEYTLTYAWSSLHVALQNHKPMLWFECVVEEQRRSEVEIACIGTGWPIEDTFWPLGSILMEDGFVWHYYAKFIND